MNCSRILRSATESEKQIIVANGERLESGGHEKMVEVLTVEVNRYAIGEECSDEGPVLFFELGQNELLVLWGQWLYDPHVVTVELLDIDEVWKRNTWFKHFALVRSPSSGLVLSLKPIGDKTVSSEGAISAGQCLPGRQSELLQGSFNTLLEI